MAIAKFPGGGTSAWPEWSAWPAWPQSIIPWTMHWTARAAWMVALCLISTTALSGEHQEKLSVTEAVDTAIRDNPDLARMQARYQALLEVPSQVGSLPDPMINLNAMNFPATNFHRRQEPMTQLQIGITQAFPFPGKLGLKREAAEFEARAVGFGVQERRLQLIAGVRSAWWQIYYLDRALETVRSNQNLLREFIQIARKKYETGIGLQQDVLLAQLEFSQLLDQEIRVESMRVNQAITLNLLMDIPGEEMVLLPSEVNQTLPAVEDKQAYFSRLAESRPLLKQKTSEVAAANTRLNSAKKDYYPDFTVGVNYGDRRGDDPDGRSRDDFFSVMVGIKIPLYANHKQDKALKQRASEAQSAHYASLDARGQIKSAIAKALTDYSFAREQFVLFKSSILPLATQTVQSMLAGYQVSEVDFLNLVRAQIALLNYELQYWRAFIEAKQSLARLEAAVGEVSIYE